MSEEDRRPTEGFLIAAAVGAVMSAGAECITLSTEGVEDEREDAQEAA